MYLSMLVETGILGLAALVWFNFSILALRAPRRAALKPDGVIPRHLDVLLLDRPVSPDAVSGPADLLARAARVLPRAGLDRARIEPERPHSEHSVPRSVQRSGRRAAVPAGSRTGRSGSWLERESAPFPAVDAWSKSCATAASPCTRSPISHSPSGAQAGAAIFCVSPCESPKLAREISRLARETRCRSPLRERTARAAGGSLGGAENPTAAAVPLPQPPRAALGRHAGRTRSPVRRARVIACCRYVARPALALRRSRPPARDLQRRGRAAWLAAAQHRRATHRRHRPHLARKGPSRVSAKPPASLAQKHPDCKFVVCGAPLFWRSRSSELLRARSRSGCRAARSNLLGWQEDVNAVLAGSTFWLCPPYASPAHRASFSKPSPRACPSSLSSPAAFRKSSSTTQPDF